MAKQSDLAARLARERHVRGWTQRQLARRMTEVAVDMGVVLPQRTSLIKSIGNWENGRYQPRPPAPMLLARVFEIDESDLFADESLWPEGQADQLTYVAAAPRRLDSAAIGALAEVLAGQRRMEDVIGSAPLIGAVTAQLHVVESLVVEARGSLRPTMLDMAAQWAQFAGWLNANSTHTIEANRWYDRALEWAIESGNRDMIATALSMKGYLSWISGQVGPLVGLSQAAQRDHRVRPGVRALAAQQEARGHALAGDRDATDRKLDEAVELALRAADRPEDEPPWIYFYGPHYLVMQRGLAYRLLGRNSEAVKLIEQGLAGLSANVRRSEWAAQYLLHIADAHAADGDASAAREVAATVEGIARDTASTRLQARLQHLDRQLC
jgi:transcriptional regulator with XRE-family HTH domain